MCRSEKDAIVSRLLALSHGTVKTGFAKWGPFSYFVKQIETVPNSAK